MVLPVTVSVGDDHFDVETTVFQGSERVRAAPQDYSGDLAVLADRIYEGLSEALDRWAEGDARGSGIGFTAV